MPSPLTRQIEDAMVARLQEKLPRAINRIEAFPDEPTRYAFPDRDTGACFVRFERSQYAGQAGSPAQAYAPKRTLTFVVALLVRALRTADAGVIGSYEALDDIRLALQGQSFAGATAMVPVSEELEEQSGNVWRWACRFSCTAPAVAALDYGERPITVTGFGEIP